MLHALYYPINKNILISRKKCRDCIFSHNHSSCRSEKSMTTPFVICRTRIILSQSQTRTHRSGTFNQKSQSESTEGILFRAKFHVIILRVGSQQQSPNASPERSAHTRRHGHNHSASFFQGKVDLKGPSRLRVCAHSSPLVKAGPKVHRRQRLDGWRTFLQPFRAIWRNHRLSVRQQRGAHQPFHTCPLCLSAMGALH